MDQKIIHLVRNLGLSDKAAKVYLACLELGEATVATLGKRSGVKRTSIYYVLEELREFGALLETKRNKKVFYVPEDPHALLAISREKIMETEKFLPLILEKKNATYNKPRLYFLYGPQGFKHIWDMIFESKSKEFMIITEGENFLDFVKEKYILNYCHEKKSTKNLRNL